MQLQHAYNRAASSVVKHTIACAADPSKPQRWHISERDLDKLPIERRRSSWLHNNDRYLKCTASDGAGARQHWERHDQMLANNMTLCEGPVSRVVCARSRGRDKNLARWCVFYGLHANLAVTGAPMLTLFCTPSQGLRSLITTTGPMGHLTKKLNPFEPSFGLVDVVADRSRWPRVAAPRDARVAVLQLGDCGTALAAPTAAKSGNPGHCSADWLNFAFAARTAAHAGLLAPAGAEDASGGGFLPLLLRGYGWARPDGRHYFHDLWHALALPLAPGPTAVELPSRGADATSCVARSAAVLSRHAPLLGGHKPAPHRDAAIVRAGLRTPSDGGDGGGDGASAGVARWVRLDGVSLPNPWTSMRWPKGPCVSAFLSPVAAAFRDRATPHMDATLLPRANASLLQSAAQRLARGGADFRSRDGVIFLVRCGTLSSHSVRCINNRVQIFEALVAAFPERTVVTRPGVRESEAEMLSRPLLEPSP